MQHFQPIPISLAHPQLLLVFHPASLPVLNRNFLLCRKRNFSLCCDRNGESLETGGGRCLIAQNRGCLWTIGGVRFRTHKSRRRTSDLDTLGSTRDRKSTRLNSSH